MVCITNDKRRYQNSGEVRLEANGWVDHHHDDLEFVLQGEVMETIYSGKAFHCLENKFYLKKKLWVDHAK